MNQCLFALNDMGDCNGEGVVYVVIPSTRQFLISNRFEAAFDLMSRDKEDWMSSCLFMVYDARGNSIYTCT